MTCVKLYHVAPSMLVGPLSSSILKLSELFRRTSILSHGGKHTGGSIVFSVPARASEQSLEEPTGLGMLPGVREAGQSVQGACFSQGSALRM